MLRISEKWQSIIFLCIVVFAIIAATYKTKQKMRRDKALTEVYCKRDIRYKDDKLDFMIHGELFSNAPVTISIVRVNNPWDMAYTEYFTGHSFSQLESDQMLVPRTDSCILKTRYFEYLNKEKCEPLF